MRGAEKDARLECHLLANVQDEKLNRRTDYLRQTDIGVFLS